MMSLQFFELIFFAILAFVIINKLISTLGISDESDKKRYKSFFGENGTIKDVSIRDISESETKNAVYSEEKVEDNIDDYIEAENSDNIKKNVKLLQQDLKNFTAQKFIKGAKGAFILILGSFNDQTKLTALVDKRYIEKLQALEISYKNIRNLNDVKATISEIYNFGKNIFIKVIFKNDSFLPGESNFSEEWTFTKSLLTKDPNWYLTNIEKV